MERDYNQNDVKSILAYAKELEGKSFHAVIESYENNDDRKKELYETYGNKSRKGGLGNLLEEVFFGYKANSKQEADFKEAGLELKVTPFEYTKKGKLKAGERLVLTMISYDKPFETDFYKSHLWEKLNMILLVYYYRNRELESNLLYEIKYVSLFTPPSEDIEIIKN
ncbi:MAG: restriction endonuclease, partial [Lachnospiraceae bacterium]|nr:restriction endonuclease [Lachnospiraceae bacterium]